MASLQELTTSRLASHIRYLRESRGIRQDHLAEGIGVTTGWLSKIENGRAWPSEKLLVELAARFGLPRDTLVRFAQDLTDREQSDSGERILDRLTQALGPPEPALPLERPLPREPMGLYGGRDIAEVAIALLATAAIEGPPGTTPEDSEIVICRHTFDDVFTSQVPPGVRALSGRWTRSLQAALAAGWNVIDIRREDAWRDEVQRQESWVFTGEGPLSVFDRIGFRGHYQAYSVASAPPDFPVSNLIDVPGIGLLTNSSVDLGAFLPVASPHRGPSAELKVVRQALLFPQKRSISQLRPVIREYPPVPGEEAGLDHGERHLQEALLRAEQEPGRRTTIRNGLPVSLEPPAMRAGRLQRHLTALPLELHENRLQIARLHEERAKAFGMRAHLGLVRDVTFAESIRMFLETGQLSPATEMDNVASEAEREHYMRGLIAALESDGYELALLDREPFDVMCTIKDSPQGPVLFIQTCRARDGGQHSVRAEVRDSTICRAVLTYLDRWWDALPRNDRDPVDVAKRLRAMI